jgi:hypothetical protein
MACTVLLLLLKHGSWEPAISTQVLKNDRLLMISVIFGGCLRFFGKWLALPEKMQSSVNSEQGVHKIFDATPPKERKRRVVGNRRKGWLL